MVYGGNYVATVIQIFMKMEWCKKAVKSINATVDRAIIKGLGEKSRGKWIKRDSKALVIVLAYRLLKE